MKAPRGVTLVELLVTLSIFAMVLTLTLYFYGQSMKANRRHDQGSEVYRRAHDVFSDVERFLGGGVLMFASEKELMLAAFPQQAALTVSRMPNWPTQAQVLAVSGERLVLRQGTEEKEFFRLKSWEQFSFATQPFDAGDKERRYDYVTLLYTGTPPSPTREGRPYTFNRQVLLARL